MKKKKAMAVTFTHGCVFERDFAYVAATLDSLHSEDRFTRVFVFDDQKAEDKWVHHDLPDWKVASVCIRSATSVRPRMACSISENGDVEMTFVGGEIVEKIPDAGLLDDDSPGYGYVNAIREIGNRLYVCGFSGQVYRRDDQGWTHFDEGLLQPIDDTDKIVQALMVEDSDLLQAAFDATMSLSDINGINEADIYTVGDEGRIYHHDGNSWTQIASPVDEDLARIKCISEKEVWICGYNGALLLGNWRDGFKDVSSVDDNDYFLSVEKYHGMVYLATESGLFTFDGNKIRPLKSGLKPELKDGHILEVKDGVLWSFGFKDLAWFDGKQWTRVHHPDNGPIR
jgi:hypothetical protein